MEPGIRTGNLWATEVTQGTTFGLPSVLSSQGVFAFLELLLLPSLSCFCCLLAWSSNVILNNHSQSHSFCLHLIVASLTRQGPPMSRTLHPFCLTSFMASSPWLLSLDSFICSVPFSGAPVVLTGNIAYHSSQLYSDCLIALSFSSIFSEVRLLQKLYLYQHLNFQTYVFCFIFLLCMSFSSWNVFPLFFVPPFLFYCIRSCLSSIFWYSTLSPLLSCVCGYTSLHYLCVCVCVCIL